MVGAVVKGVGQADKDGSGSGLKDDHSGVPKDGAGGGGGERDMARSEAVTMTDSQY